MLLIFIFFCNSNSHFVFITRTSCSLHYVYSSIIIRTMSYNNKLFGIRNRVVCWEFLIIFAIPGYPFLNTKSQTVLPPTSRIDVLIRASRRYSFIYILRLQPYTRCNPVSPLLFCILTSSSLRLRSNLRILPHSQKCNAVLLLIDL